MIHYRVPVAIERRGEQSFSHRHSNSVSKPLTKWTGGGFHAGRVAVLGMAGRLTLPLPEVLDVVERQVISREIQNAVQQHRCMAGREDESVAVEPARIGRVESEVPTPQHISER